MYEVQSKDFCRRVVLKTSIENCLYLIPGKKENVKYIFLLVSNRKQESIDYILQVILYFFVILVSFCQFALFLSVWGKERDSSADFCAD